jgi:hypothetical protein
MPGLFFFPLTPRIIIMPLRRAYTQPMAGLQGFARTRKLLGGNVPILAADLVAANQVAGLIVPAGFMLNSLMGSVPKLDTNVTMTLTISIGDAANNARFVSASTVGQAGGAMPASLVQFYVFPADTEMLITFPAGAATAAAGTIVLYLDGWASNP